MSRFINRLGLVCCVGALTASCNKDPEPAPVATYEGHCEIEVTSTQAPIEHTLRQEGPTEDEAATLAWTGICTELGQPECRDTLPDGMASTQSAMTITANGVTTYAVQVVVSDSRLVDRGEGRAERRGPQAEVNSELLCQEALLIACLSVGVDGDCVAGDVAAFRVTSQSSEVARVFGSE